MIFFKKFGWVLVFCTQSLLLAQPQPAPKPCAEAVVVVGKVHREPGPKPIVLGESLPEGTRIKTEKDAFVKLLLRDNSVLDLSPQTQVVLKTCAAPALTGIDLELELGRVRANVNPKPAEPRKNFQMKTPTSVLAVRGTEFFAHWTQERSGIINERISVSEGQVEVRSLFEKNASPTLLKTGTELRAESVLSGANRPVSKVEQFNTAEQRKLEQEQTIEVSAFMNAVDVKRGRVSVTQLGPEGILEPKREVSSANRRNERNRSDRRNAPQAGGSTGNSLGGTSQPINAQSTFVTGTFSMGVKK